MSTELIEQAKNEIMPIETKGKALVVKDADTRAQAVDLRKEIKDGIEKIEKKYHFKENTGKAHKTWKSNKDTENSVYNPIEALDVTIKGKVNAYDRDEALKAKRIADAAEVKRREDERKERERLEEKAEKAEEKGKTEKAEELREQAETVSFAPRFTAAPKGVKKLITYARITNMTKLCKAIGEGEIPFSVLQVNQSQLNAWAKGQDVKSKYDGIELYEDVSGRI